MIYVGDIGPVPGCVVSLLEVDKVFHNQDELTAEHLQEVSSADPGGTQKEQDDNATVSLQRFSR